MEQGGGGGPYILSGIWGSQMSSTGLFALKKRQLLGDPLLNILFFPCFSIAHYMEFELKDTIHFVNSLVPPWSLEKQLDITE